MYVMESKKNPSASPNDSSGLSAAFRCDASAQIGAGHVMRCLALGQELRRQGYEVVFVLDARAIEWIEADLRTFVTINPSEVDWSRFTSVVVDSYTATAEEIREIRQSGPSVVVVADDATPRLPADLYIEPGVSQSWRPPAGFDAVPRLRGPGAILLRDEIQAARRRRAAEQSAPPKGQGVLLVLGSAGTPSLYWKIVQELLTVDRQLKVDVVGDLGGDMFLLPNVTCHPPGSSLTPLLANAEVVISAAGVTAWEALYFGAVLGLVQTVSNQGSNYDFMTSHGLAAGLGRVNLSEPFDMVELRRLLATSPSRTRSSLRGVEVVDGQGCVRAAMAMLALASRGNADGGVSLWK